ncbi:MAG: hypothetical protein GX810_08580 [Clostridiales bacterium]|nr:hypothetical protein [Clostridiales bacterium]
MQMIDLTKSWRIRPEFLDMDIRDYAQVLERPEGELRFFRRTNNRKPSNDGWLTADLPCDVIQPLVKQGLLEEPLEKQSTWDALWVKDLSWWFVKTFSVTQKNLDEECAFLRFEMLDFKADIVLNGAHVGHHANAFVPFEQDVKRYLKKGVNTLIVRLTSGVEDFYNHTSISHFAGSPHAIYDKRMYLRKPQFSYGWDWCKPVPTCGIGRGATLQFISGARISHLRVVTTSIGDKAATLQVHVEVDQLLPHATDDVIIDVAIRLGGKVLARAKKDARVVGGLSFHTFEMTVKNPRLWMPNGYGEQPLYDVDARVTCRGQVNAHKPLRVGIRMITLHEPKQPDGTYLYQFQVNGVPIYCKGGNWVPADSVYLRVPDSTYKTLVEEAREQHFTMLRMWGGGLYEPDVFYEACDENGILLMHDFMYACSYYPDHLDWFLHEATKEADYQTRRLANHACMAIWTGNNEIHESYTDWFPRDENLPYLPGAKIFNDIQARVVQGNCPEIPYKPSSAYGGALSNSQEEGDSHVWRWMHMLSLQYPGMAHTIDACGQLTTRFSSEYGFHGPIMESSWRRALGDDKDFRFDSPVWIHHGDPLAKREPILKCIDQYFTDADTLTEADYLLYGGVNQGMLYREMGDALRKKDYCWGHLIWMYNDCWPETGWTTVDYYLTRKISFYFLRRAFAPRKLLLTEEGNQVRVILHNESPEPITLRVRYGSAGYDAKNLAGTETVLTQAPFTRSEVLTFDADADGYAFVLPLDAPDIDPATTVRGHYRALPLKDARVRITEKQRDGGDVVLTLVSDAYAPVVYLACQDDRTHLSDNYFELLPGIAKTVRVRADEAEGIAVKVLKITRGKPTDG